MDLFALVDPVYLVVLLLSILVMFGLHRLISKFSSSATANTQAPVANEGNIIDRANPNRENEEEEDGESDDEEPNRAQNAGQHAAKMLGKKKRAKMEREAARKEFNRYQLEQNKEKVTEQKKQMKELRKQERTAEKEQAIEDEAWEKHLQEKQKKEEEEYQSWKSTMSLDASGSGESEKTKLERRAEDVIAVVKRDRIVILEALSATFHTSTAKMVELLTELVKERRLEGIFDEHGKFIFVSQEDRLKIAKIVQRRGRVGIAELTREVNSVISIDPVLPEETPLAAPSDPAALLT